MGKLKAFESDGVGCAGNDEVYVSVSIDIDKESGQAILISNVTFTNDVPLDIDSLIKAMRDIGGVGIDGLPEGEDECREHLAKWLTVAKSGSGAA